MTPPEAEPRARQPLLLVALAFVMLQVRGEVRGYDALPDPIGWLFIAVACAALPADVPRRGAIVFAAVLAMAVSVAHWPSEWNDQVLDLDKALLWAIAMPGLLWSILFCLAIAYLAGKDLAASVMWKYLAGAFIAATLLPIVVFGGGVDALEGTYAAITVIAQLGLFALCLLHAWKPWAMIARAAPESG